MTAFISTSIETEKWGIVALDSVNLRAIALRILVTGTSSYEVLKFLSDPVLIGVGAVALVVASRNAASTSLRIILPLGPDPAIVEMSMSSSFACFLASGDANTRS